jgi:hypothetical protein
MSSDPSLPQTVEGESSEHLLAELDDLLERMLALPVNHLDEPPEEPVRRTEAPPEDIPVITVAEAMPEAITEAPAPEAVSTVQDDLYFQAILQHPPMPEPQAIKPPPPVIMRREVPAPVEIPPLPEEPPRSVLPPAPPPLSPWLLPLSWCNWVFDRTTTPLGAPGRWLRHPAGRALLGWTGLLCLVIAAGLAVGDALGWTW